MRDEAGAVLLSQRAAHKPHPGQWEFPGGKVEPAEAVEGALHRELQEELGIDTTEARPLIRVRHDYPELAVCLDVWEVLAWRGQPHGREGQALAWVGPYEIEGWPLLAADAPIISALQLPDAYAFTSPDMTATAVLQGLEALPPDALLRLRLPTMPDAEYRALAEAVCAAKGPQRTVVDRGARLAEALGCWWHVDGLAMAQCLADGRALPARAIVSVHDAATLGQARQAGAAAAVVGPVCETATHPGAAGMGWSAFQTLADTANLSLYAIGGMTPEDAARARHAGGRGVAGIRAFW